MEFVNLLSHITQSLLQGGPTKTMGRESVGFCPAVQEFVAMPLHREWVVSFHCIIRDNSSIIATRRVHRPSTSTSQRHHQSQCIRVSSSTTLMMSSTVASRFIPLPSSTYNKPFVLSAFFCLQCFDTAWLGGRKGIRPVKKWWDGGGGHWLVRMEWCPAGWSVCLPLLIFRCTIKSRSSLLAPAHPGGPGKRAVKRMWCGGVVYSTSVDYLGAWFVVEIYVELLFIICFQCNDEIIVSFCGLSLLMPCCCPDLSTVYIGYNWLIADTMLLLYLTAHNCLLVMMSILSIVHLYSCLLTWYIQGGGKKHMPLSTVSQKVGRYSTVCELQSKIWLHITVNLLLSVVVKES